MMGLFDVEPPGRSAQELRTRQSCHKATYLGRIIFIQIATFFDLFVFPNGMI
jgi:hypothetical protein